MVSVKHYKRTENCEFFCKSHRCYVRATNLFCLLHNISFTQTFVCSTSFCWVSSSRKRDFDLLFLKFIFFSLTTACAYQWIRFDRILSCCRFFSISLFRIFYPFAYIYKKHHRNISCGTSNTTKWELIFYAYSLLAECGWKRVEIAVLNKYQKKKKKLWNKISFQRMNIEHIKCTLYSDQWIIHFEDECRNSIRNKKTFYYFLFLFLLKNTQHLTSDWDSKCKVRF